MSKRKPKIEEMRPEPEHARREEAKAKVISYVLAGYSQTAAAEKVGVHESTITRWKADPEFARMLDDPDAVANAANEVWKNEGRTNIQLKKAADIAVLRYKLQGVAATAIDVLADLLHSEDDRVRLGAVREVLDRTGMVRSSEVTVTGSIASQVSPTMIAEAFQVLGISPEEVRKSLPVDGTIIDAKEEPNGRSHGSDSSTDGLSQEAAARSEEGIPAGGEGAPVSSPAGMRVPGECDSTAISSPVDGAETEGAGL